MDLNDLILKDSLHHAYCVEGHCEIAREKVLSFLERDLGFSVKGNPDFYYEKYTNFGIDDARKLSFAQLRKPVQQDKKIFLIEFSSITHEAQNALLKIFEEPVSHTHFFIVVERSDVLILTLQSRLFFVKVAEERISEKNNFLKMSLSDRLSYVKKMTDDLKDEKISKSDIIIFVENLEKEVYRDWKSGDGREMALSEIMKVEGYIKDRSSSVKQLLEHLAITLPVV